MPLSIKSTILILDTFDTNLSKTDTFLCSLQYRFKAFLMFLLSITSGSELYIAAYANPRAPIKAVPRAMGITAPSP